MHNVIEAIRPMSPAEFMQLPAGQRLLILAKGKDVVNSQDPRLNAARAEFLTVLPTLAVFANPQDYTEIIRPALQYAFEIPVTGQWIGDKRIRGALNLTASRVGQENHAAFTSVVLKWLNECHVDRQENWFLHDVRLLISRLMANVHCKEDDARKFADQLAHVNRVQIDQRTGDDRGFNVVPREGQLTNDFADQQEP